MAYSGNTGLKRILMAGLYSWQGFKAAFRKEEAFRQEVYLSAVLIPLAFYLGDNGMQIAMMVGSVLLVLMVEILNSAIEAVVDRIGMEPHKLSGRAKDMGSSAVLLSLINVVVVWSLVLFYK
ncbi:MAG: diacylglycerol kinase [Gammaproteobacteria bacterium]|nr:diacylglycerol kinase [Gammaproteobacteria bacterium]